MKTLLIDDHPLFREGLAIWMKQALPQFEPLQANSLGEALKCIDAEGDIGLALLDLALSDAQGIDGLLALRRHSPDLNVVVITGDERRETVLAALDAGASGFIPKSLHVSSVQAALSVIAEGGVFLPKSVWQDHAMPQLTAEPAVSAEAVRLGWDLSERQQAVLKLLIEGKTNKVICRELDLSASTVKTHITAIFRKLEVGSRTQAVMAAAKAGWRAGPGTH